jgi:TP901 family phage tail tape measure protein
LASVNVGVLHGTVELDHDDWDAGIASIISGLTTASGVLTSFGATAALVGAGLTAGITLPLLALGKASVEAFSTFEHSLTKSTAIMGGLTDELRQKVSDTAREMAKETVFSANEIAGAFHFLASAGYEAAESIEAMPKVAQFAQAGFFDLEKATTLLVDSQAALGLRTKDTAQNMINMARVSDVLVKANNLANASVEDFAKSLTNKSAGALKLVNKSIEEGVAVLAAYAEQGVKAQLAGEKLNIILRDLQTAAIKHPEVFQRMGIAVYDANGNMRNMAVIIRDLEKAFVGMSDEQKRSSLMMLGFQDRSVAAIASLIGMSDKIAEYERQLKNAGGTTKEVADKAIKNLADQFDLLKKRVHDLFLEIGEALAPTMMKLIDIFKLLLTPLEMAVKWFGDLSQPMKDVTIAVAACAAVFGPLLAIIGTVVAVAGAAAGAFAGTAGAATVLTAAFEGMGLALAAVWPLLGAAGVIGGVIALTFAFEALDEATKDSWEAMEAGMATTSDLTSLLGQAVVRGVFPFNAMWRDVIDTFHDVANAAGILWDQLKSLPGFGGLGGYSGGAGGAGLPAAPKSPFEKPGGKGDIELPFDTEAAAAGANQLKGMLGDLEGRLNAAKLEVQALSTEMKENLTAAFKSGAFSLKVLHEETGISMEGLKLFREQMEKSEKATKATGKAAKEAAKDMKEYIGTLRQLGVFTQQVTDAALQPLINKFIVAGTAGREYLGRAIVALYPEFNKLAKEMTAAGASAEVVWKVFNQLYQASGMLTLQVKTFTTQLALVKAPMVTVTQLTKDQIQAARDATTAQKTLEDAFHSFGMKTPQELNKIADEAQAAYERIANTAGVSYEAIRIAAEKSRDAQIAAGRIVPTVWETEILPGIMKQVDKMTNTVSDSLARMILHMKGWKEAALDVWKSFQEGVAQILSEILQDFIGRFLKGLLYSMMGQQGAMSKAFGGLVAGGPGQLPGAPGGGSILGSLFGLFGGGGSGLPAVAQGGTFGGLVPGGVGTAATPWYMTTLGGSLLGAGAGAAVGWGVGSASGNTLGGAGSGALAGAGVGALFGGPIGAGVGAGVGALTGWYAAKRQNKMANDLRDQFFGEYGGGGTGAGSGFMTVASQLTEMTGEAGGGKLFEDLIKANDLGELREAIEAVNKVLDEYKEKQEAASTADQKRVDELQKVVDKHQAVVDSVKASLKDLDTEEAKWDAAEAVEEVMGVEETRAREKIASRRQELTAELAAAQAAHELALKELEEASKKAAEGIAGAFNKGFEELVRGVGGVRDAFDSELGDMNYDIDMNYRRGGEIPEPGPNPLPRAAGGIYTTGQAGVATWFGEGGAPEMGGPVSFMSDVLAEAMKKSGATSAGPTVIFSDGAFRMIDGKDLRELVTREVVPIMTDVYRRDDRGARTDHRSALGVS